MNAPLVVPLLDGTTLLMTVDEAKAALAAKGLHVVSPVEKAVLDAMGRIPRQRLEWEAEQGSSPAKAELRRRGLG